MSFEVFAENLMDCLRNIAGEKADVKLMTAVKNNSRVYTGVNIVYPGDKVIPNLYIDSYYREDFDEEYVEATAKAIYNDYLKFKKNTELNIDELFKYDNIKDKIYIKVINTKLNEDFLKNVPHKRFLDLSAVVYFKFSDSNFPDGYVVIRNEHLKGLGVSEKELIERALENTKSLEFNISPISEVLREMILSNKTSGLNSEEESDMLSRLDLLDEAIQMYVVRNGANVFGAAPIILKDFFADFSNDLGKNLYILPSSVHELIIVPDNGEKTSFEFNEMVKCVNDTDVPPEDILSDHIYYYDRTLNKVLSM